MILSKKVISCFIILSVAIVIALGMRQMKPSPKQHTLERSIASVAVMNIELSSLNSDILSHGTISAKQHSAISAEVNGKIIYRSEKFSEGSFVKKGDLLLRIDNTDYDVGVAEAQSLLLERQLTLKDKSASFGKNSLPAQQAKAAQTAAEKKLIQAQRDLRNTEVRAAFNGIVLNRRVDIGQFISIGLPLFDLSGTDMAEVSLPINSQDIEQLNNQLFQKNINTTIHLSSDIGTHGNSIKRTLNSARLQGTINSQTHVFYINVDIPDPYNFKATNQHQKPLALGSFVNARIGSQTIANAIRLPMQYVQQDNTVYLYVEGVLKKTTVTIMRTENQHVIISAGLNNGDQLVTTQLPVMYDGMPVKIKSAIAIEPSHAE